MGMGIRSVCVGYHKHTEKAALCVDPTRAQIITPCTMKLTSRTYARDSKGNHDGQTKASAGGQAATRPRT